MTVGEPKELWTFEGTRLTEHCLFVGRQRFVLFVPPLLKSFRKEESLQFNHLKKNNTQNSLQVHWKSHAK